MRYLLNGICCLRLVILPMAIVSGCAKPENRTGEMKPDASPRPSPTAKRIETELGLKALLAGIEPGERVHLRLSQYASRIGFRIFGGSGAGEVFYKFGPRTVMVRKIGRGFVYSIGVYEGSFPDGVTLYGDDEYWLRDLVVGDECPLPPVWPLMPFRIAGDKK